MRYPKCETTWTDCRLFMCLKNKNYNDLLRQSFLKTFYFFKFWMELRLYSFFKDDKFYLWKQLIGKKNSSSSFRVKSFLIKKIVLYTFQGLIFQSSSSFFRRKKRKHFARRISVRAKALRSLDRIHLMDVMHLKVSHSIKWFLANLQCNIHKYLC